MKIKTKSTVTITLTGREAEALKRIHGGLPDQTIEEMDDTYSGDVKVAQDFYDLLDFVQ